MPSANMVIIMVKINTETNAKPARKACALRRERGVSSGDLVKIFTALLDD